MTILVGILALVFLALTVIVIVKTQDLLKGVQGKTEELEDLHLDKANDWNAIGLFVFWIVCIVGLIWSYMDARKLFLPEASSIHGRETDYWFWVSMIVIMIAFVVVNSFLFYFPIKYRYRKGKKATFYPHNNKLEVIWTVIPALVMAGLVFTGLKVWNEVMDDAPEDAEVIEIMGRQFAWEVRYPGVDDNKLGEYDYRLIDDATSNSFGIDFTDPNSFDDFTSATEIHIPKGKPVLLKIRARDVLHSVFIPHMRVKMDAVPGMPTKFWFVTDKSTEDMRKELGNPDFNYEVACTEICGRGHFSMRLLLIVDEQEDYDAWKKEQKSFLSMNPGFIEKVPDNLKARALKYLESEPVVAEVVEVTEEVTE